MWPCHIAALGWMPWVVLFCDRLRIEGRRRFVLAALAGGLQMMTGSPEIIIFTWVIVAGSFLVWYWTERQMFWTCAGRLARVVALICGLCAAQLLPPFDLLANGDRTTAAGDSTWAMPLWGMANFLAPLFRMNSSVSGVYMQADQQWTTSYYVGMLTLALALLALWKVRGVRIFFLAAVTVLGLWCALGDEGMLLSSLRSLLPALGVTRFPIKFVVLPIFCLPLLAAAGVMWLQHSPLRTARLSLAWTAALVGIGVAVFAFGVPFDEDSRGVTVGNGIIRLLALAAGAALLFLQPRMAREPGQLLVGFGFLLLLGLDVYTHFPRQNPTVPVAAYDAFSPTMTQLPRMGDSRAMLGREAQTLMGGVYNRDLLGMFLGQRTVLYSDCNLLEQIPKVNGFISIQLEGEAKVSRELYREGPAENLRKFLGVSQVCERLFAWTPVTNHMRWASIGQQPLFRDEVATLAELMSPHFAPRQLVYLPLENQGEVTAVADPSAEVVASSFTAEHCDFKTQSTNRTMLVLAQSYYHCWKAAVDGARVPLLLANAGFQAVEVPAGVHQVALVYQDRAFQIGSDISLVTLMFCLITIMVLPHKADRLAKANLPQ